MELIYIGKKFYFESGTIMSSIYNADGSREDWGSIQFALENREIVSIRPADDSEFRKYQKHLDDIIKKRREKEMRLIIEPPW